MKFYLKVLGLCQKKYWLNLLNFGCTLLQNSLLGNVYSDPIFCSTLQKQRESHFRYCCRVPLAIPFILTH
jgi:hypothetical protein